MSNKKNFWERWFGRKVDKSQFRVPRDKPAKAMDVVKPIPNGRVSTPTHNGTGLMIPDRNGYQMVNPEDMTKVIPILRKLFRVNPDLGSVVFDLTQLTNTGHTIKFDQSVSAKDAAAMRAHLEKVSDNWHEGVAGIDGLINKWVIQIYITGALSNEWVPKLDLSGIDYNTLVDTETIVFGKKLRGKYEPFQRSTINGPRTVDGLIKLNPYTYKYFGLMGDNDTPYGIPPFITALCAMDTQKDMDQNIRNIIDQVGLLGYLQVKIDKPDINAGESYPQYEKRLENILTETRKNMSKGMKDGIAVGYEGDHEFEFHSATKSVGGVNEIYNLNQVKVANGLKTSPIFLGTSAGSSETFISVVFSKMLSQLKNTQQIISKNLQKGYELELAMAGFKYKSLKVEFKPSTITDDVKIQQGREAKQRINRALWVDGIISQETYAEEMGFIKPAKKRDPIELHITPPKDETNPDQTEEKVKKDKREADKDKSDRNVRDKNKPTPKRKDQSTKPT